MSKPVQLFRSNFRWCTKTLLLVLTVLWTLSIFYFTLFVCRNILSKNKYFRSEGMDKSFYCFFKEMFEKTRCQVSIESNSIYLLLLMPTLHFFSFIFCNDDFDVSKQQMVNKTESDKKRNLFREKNNQSHFMIILGHKVSTSTFKLSFADWMLERNQKIIFTLIEMNEIRSAIVAWL